MTETSSLPVSLIVPTLERPDFLMRLMHFYQLSKFTGKILIGDGSKAQYVKQTQTALKHIAPNLDISHWHFPGAGVAQVVRELSSKISTPYVALVADDDFLVPSALEKCVMFLEENPDYGAAHGAGISFSLTNTGAYGKIASCGYYPQPLREEPEAARRLIAHLQDYSVSLFSLHRTEIWREMFSATEGIHDVSFSAELLPCCISVVLGKIKQLDGLMLVRQVHDRRYGLPDMYDWVTDEAWCQSYAFVHERLAQIISRQDFIDRDEGKIVVKRGFSIYLRNLQERRITRGLILWRRRIKRMPGAHFAWHWVQKIMSGNQFSLPMLLKPTSPYHGDFMNIHNVIAQPQDSAAWLSAKTA